MPTGSRAGWAAARRSSASASSGASPNLKLAAPARSSNEWINANVVPSPSDESSNDSRSVPHVNVSVRGASTTSTVPVSAELSPERAEAHRSARAQIDVDRARKPLAEVLRES